MIFVECFIGLAIAFIGGLFADWARTCISNTTMNICFTLVGIMISALGWAMLFFR